MNTDRRDRSYHDEYYQETHANGLDPELDLRNINFATGENKYLNENQNLEEPCIE